MWHPVHPALGDTVPYVVLLVELPRAGGIRMVSNLVGDRLRHIAAAGDVVRAEFEDHAEEHPPYALVQWALERGGRR